MSAASCPPLVQAGQGGLDQGQVRGKKVPAEAALSTSPRGPSALAGAEVPAPPQLPPSPRCPPQSPAGACPALCGRSVLRYQQAVTSARVRAQGWEAGPGGGALSHQTSGPRKIRVGAGQAGGRDSLQESGPCFALGFSFPISLQQVLWSASSGGTLSSARTSWTPSSLTSMQGLLQPVRVVSARRALVPCCPLPLAQSGQQSRGQAWQGVPCRKEWGGGWGEFGGQTGLRLG